MNAGPNPPIELPPFNDAAFPLTLEISLAQPATRLTVRSVGVKLGRAEAVFGTTSWAAKHHWTEGKGQEAVTVFEFDEPIPAGTEIALRIPAG